MRKLLVITLLGALLFVAIPGAALAGGSWHGGHFGGHGGWWGPGAIIGGLALGVAAIVTAPFWALSAAPAYSPPVASAPPAAYSVPPTYAPPPMYASPPPPTYQSAPSYAPPRASAVQREVVYPNGRYVLYGDGVNQPWQWVWVPSASPPPSPSPPQ
jgi:hypothetical protein